MVHRLGERSVRAAVMELLGAVILIAAYLWFGRNLFPGALFFFATLLLLLTGSSHRRTGEHARDLGFRFDTALPAAAWLLPVVAIAATIALGVASHLRALHLPPATQAARSLAQFIASGMLQQYLLLGFFYRRTLEMMRSPMIAAVVTTTVFAALHTPNLFLVCVTWAAGLICCAVYRRVPNVYVSGAAHGLLAYVLYVTLPARMTGGMRVGLEYLQQCAR